LSHTSSPRIDLWKQRKLHGMCATSLPLSLSSFSMNQKHIYEIKYSK
jgi:hypothetical protein